MALGRARFAGIRVAWADAATSDPVSPDVLHRFGEQQLRRFRSLQGVEAQRFMVGRAMLTTLIDELIGELTGECTDGADIGFTTTCERCGADHGRPRLEGAPLAVSVSYAGSMVAVAAAHRADAAAVGIDLEREPVSGAPRLASTLARLFTPEDAPDTAGWTLIEAALKVDGRGIDVDFAEVRVGELGSGRIPASRVVEVPGRTGDIDAAVMPGPLGFVLSAAILPAGAPHPQ